MRLNGINCDAYLSSLLLQWIPDGFTFKLIVVQWNNGVSEKDIAAEVITVPHSQPDGSLCQG